MVASKAVLRELAVEPGSSSPLVTPEGPSHAAWRIISRPRFKQGLFLAGDLMAIWLSHALAERFTLHRLGVPLGFLNPFHYYLFYIPFFAAVVYLFQGYKNPDLRRPERELEVMSKAVSFFFVALVCANFVLFKAHGFSRYLLVYWYFLSLFFVLGWRFAIRAGYGSLWRRGLARERALLAGSPERLAAFQNGISVQRHARHDIIGVLVESAASNDLEETKSDLPVLGVLEDWEQIASQCDIRWMLLNLPADDFRPDSYLFDLIRRCHEKGIEVEVHSDLFGCSEFRYERDEFSALFRFYAPSDWSRPVQKMVKIALDRFIGAVGSLITLLLTPFIALLLKIEDDGPVFYRREFVDCNREVRHYLKFRSMVKNADQLLQSDRALKQQFDAKYKLEADPRVLRIGRILRKYSIDEFPQFFSLLTGKLTFVGPRVISREETSRYGDSLAKLLSVRPGMTGYWQVMGRQTTSYEERVQMDMFYIDHWSLWLDLIIMAKTFRRVIGAEGAC
jgi:exopolysaccharide biosynthesis polyprenyl glycosylphosphotransferase